MKDNVKYCPHNTGGNHSEKQAIPWVQKFPGKCEEDGSEATERYAYTRRRCLP